MTLSNPVTEWYGTSKQSALTAYPRRGACLHHGAIISLDALIETETTGSRVVSSNRCVKDLRNAQLVDDDMRAWSLSSPYYDSVLWSVECANESTDGWTISSPSHETLAVQVAYWAQEGGWWPHRDGDPRTWTVFGHREIYTIFGASYATACPGGMDLDWITARAQQLLLGNIYSERDTMTSLYMAVPPATVSEADKEFLSSLVSSGPLTLTPKVYVIALCGDSPNTRANVQLTQLDKLGNQWAADHTGTWTPGAIDKGGRLLSWQHFIATLKAYMTPTISGGGGGGSLPDYQPLVDVIKAQTAVLGEKLDKMPAEIDAFNDGRK